MSKIKLTGSNSGYVEIDSAADAGNLTLTLPTSGVRLLSNTDNVFSGITTTAELDINGKIDVSTDIVGGRNLKVTGITTLSDDLTLTGASYNVLWDKSDNQLEFGDNAKLSFGASSDLQIYHESNNNYINATNGTLFVRGSDLILEDAGGNDYVVCADTGTGGSVTLKHEGSSKLVTASGGVTVTGTVAATSFSGSGEGLTRTTPLSHRNRIINGDMQISQRYGTTETTINNASMHYILDRFAMYESTDGSATVTQVTSGYTASHTGSGKAMRIKTTGADTTLNGSEQLMFFQTIEGYNWEDMRFGTANAKSFTVSFSILVTGASSGNVTGTYCVNATNAPNFNRSYVKEYTISAVDTWQRVSLTFPGDTSGSWGTGNGAAIRIGWSFAGPTSQQAAANQWHSGYKGSSSNQKNGMANVNNFYFITDVQVEEGTVATPFERRNIAEELTRCQRYFVKTDFSSHCTAYFGGTHLFRQIQFACPTPMRAQPSFSVTGSEGGTTKFTLKTWSSDQNMTATPNSVHRHHTDYVHGTNSGAVHSVSLGIDFSSGNSGVPPNGPGNHNVYACRMYGANLDAEL